MSVTNIIEALGSKVAGGPTEMGKIKIGGKAAQVRTTAGGKQWRAPEKHDYFTITTLNRDARGDLIPDDALMDQLREEYGDPSDGKLRRIPIRLLSDEIDDVIQSAFVWYGNKSVGARSDGKTVTWFYDPETNQRYPEPVVQEWGPDLLERKRNGQALFKVHSVLNCVIAAKEARWGGVYKFRTTSLISLRQMHASLLHLLQLTGGMLVGMPLQLVVRPIQVSPEGKTTTVHVVHVELRGGDLLKLQQDALQMAQFRLTFKEQIQKTQVQYRKLLALPGSETGDEAAEIQGEFVPEAPEVQPVPADKPYSLLDDAPAPAPVADLSKAAPPAPAPHVEVDVMPEPEEPPADPEYTSSQYDDVPEAHGNVSTATVAATVAAPVIPAADLKLVETYPKFLETLNLMAMDASISPSQLEKWLDLRLVTAGMKGRGEKTSIPWRLQVVEEMRHWRL